MGIVNRGFGGRRQQLGKALIPPGQYLVDGFPVLTAGPTPETPLAEWDFTIVDETGEEAARWTSSEFRALPAEEFTVDIHCVTKWSKLATRWRGVPVESLLEGIDTSAEFGLAFSDGGYTTNLPLEALYDDDVLVAHTYAGEPLEHDHGAPARLVVPSRYFWKSAKFLRRLEILPEDRQGFWELNGYHNDADPWQEQRHWF